MDLGLAGAAVCVQGGSKGMGRAAAECFAEDGARVVVLARGKDALDRTVGRLTEIGCPDAWGIPADVTDPAAVEAAFAAIADRWGELNVLVNASGPGSLFKPWHEVQDSEWLNFFDAIALGAIRSARAALPLLRTAAWGRIVNVCAMSTRSHGFGLAEYTAAKSALSSVTKNQSLELAPDGILVNAVSPGTFVSSMMIDYLTEADRDERPNRPRSADGTALPSPTDLVGIMTLVSDQYGVRCDLGRAGEPKEIGPAIAFLASRRNTYITGANLNVDGGSAFL